MAALSTDAAHEAAKKAHEVAQNAQQSAAQAIATGEKAIAAIKAMPKATSLKEADKGIAQAIHSAMNG